MLRAAGKLYIAMADKTYGEIANGTSKLEGNPFLTYPANIAVLSCWSAARCSSGITLQNISMTSSVRSNVVMYDLCLWGPSAATLRRLQAWAGSCDFTNQFITQRTHVTMDDVAGLARRRALAAMAEVSFQHGCCAYLRGIAIAL
jgi:hypothetical protein